jgi:FkbM family methyltransferase
MKNNKNSSKLGIKTIFETVPLYYLFTRLSFPIRSFQTYLYSFMIRKLEKRYVKKDVKSMQIMSSDAVLEMTDGAKFFWKHDDRNSLLGLAALGEWEKSDTDFLRMIVRSGNTVFDIGANYGFHTILFANTVGEKGMVHSFEPLNSGFDELTKNVKVNNVLKNVKLNKLGLGNKPETVTIYTYNELGSGASSLHKRWIGQPVEQKCKIITLDSYVEQHKIKKVDFIKCDIEGGEYLVLEGGMKTLKKFKPKLMLEITSAIEGFGHKREEIFRLLNTLGYSAYTIANGKPMKVKNQSQVHFHGNCFFIPNKS